LRSTAALCNLLAGCALANSGPTVAVTPFGAEPWSEDDVSMVMEGARAWEDLGFLYVLDPEELSDIPVCPFDWSFKGLTECRIRVGVQRVPNDQLPPGAAAYADRSADIATFGADFHGRYLVHLGAHELGHILLNTSQHLGPHVPGIMQSGSDLTVPTVGDWSLACVATSICPDG
jgi:hypothetical protein